MSDNVNTLEPMLNGMSSTLSFTGKQAARITAPTLLIEGEHTTTLFRALSFLEDFIRFVRSHADVWVTTTNEIAARV